MTSIIALGVLTIADTWLKVTAYDPPGNLPTLTKTIGANSTWTVQSTITVTGWEPGPGVTNMAWTSKFALIFSQLTNHVIPNNNSIPVEVNYTFYDYVGSERFTNQTTGEVRKRQRAEWVYSIEAPEIGP